MAAEEVYGTYVAAWDEPDPKKRDRLLERSLADDVFVAYPPFEANDRAGVNAFIGGLHERFPGLRIVQHSGIEEHHGWLRVAWRILLDDGSTRRDGVDVAEVGPDGRLRRVLGFHDPLPPR
jgi:hypothetical protein